ncbi:MAG: hypothetical protein ACKOPC_12685 [Methylocystis sp.]
MAQKPQSKSQAPKPKTSKRKKGLDAPNSLAWVWSEFKGEFPQSEDDKKRLTQLELNFKREGKISPAATKTDKKNQVAQNLARISKSKHAHESSLFAAVKEKNEIKIALISFAGLILFFVIYSFSGLNTPPQNAPSPNPIPVETQNKQPQNSSPSPINETKNRENTQPSKIEEKANQNPTMPGTGLPTPSQSDNQTRDVVVGSQNALQEAIRSELIEEGSLLNTEPSSTRRQESFIEYLLNAQSLLKSALKENPNAETAEALDKIDQLRFSYIQEAIHLLEQSQSQPQEMKDIVYQLKLANIRPDTNKIVPEDLSPHKTAGIMITEQNSLALLSILPLAVLALLLIIYLFKRETSVTNTVFEEQPIESAMKNSFIQALNNPEYSHEQIVDLVHSLRSINNANVQDGEKRTALLIEEKLSPQDAGRFYIFRHQLIRAGLLLSSLLLGLLFPIVAIGLVIIVSLLIYRRLYPEICAHQLNKLAYAEYINKFCNLAEKLLFY